MKLKNISLIFFSIFFFSIIIEIILRLNGDLPRKNPDFTVNEPLINIPDPVLGWKPKIGSHKFKPWSINGKETYLTINKDKIIFIGGSITQGWAVSDDETFPYIFQKNNLNHKVYNFGVGGYGGHQSLLMLEKVFKDKDKIKLVVYGLIPHHEIRNTAAGSWMYLLNFFSKRGFISLPYASIDKEKKLIKHQPIKYLTLPFGKDSALVAKIEKRIMKIRSLLRERKQTEISLSIIKEMNELSLINNSKFVLLFLEDFNDDRFKEYDLFLTLNNINHIKCLMPKGQKYIVPGDGHPNDLSHYEIGKCVDQKIKINNLIQ